MLETDCCMEQKSHSPMMKPARNRSIGGASFGRVVMPMMGLLAILDPWSWLWIGGDRAFASGSPAAGSLANSSLLQGATQQPSPVPPDAGSPRRSQGSGTR